jgi:hypothetical protein
MPLFFEYYEQDGKKRMSVRYSFNGMVQPEPFLLETEEASKLSEFLRTSSIPLQQPYVDLAFRLLELSYTALGTGLPFLSVFAGLEALLNPGRDEATHRISRSTALLLSQNTAEYRANLGRMKKLYGLHSTFIHEGDESAIEKSDLTAVRNILRSCTKSACRLNTSKSDLTKQLDEGGFSLPWQHTRSTPAT